MASEDTYRDNSGRFLKGAPGRPKGAKNKHVRVTPEEFKSSVVQEANDRLEKLLVMAIAVLEDKLLDGDLRAAVWALEQTNTRHGPRLNEAIPYADLSSVEGIVSTAQSVIEMTADQRLSITDASKFLRILSSYGQLRGFLKVKELEEALSVLEKNADGPGGKVGEASRLIKWGRFSSTKDSSCGDLSSGSLSVGLNRAGSAGGSTS